MMRFTKLAQVAGAVLGLVAGAVLAGCSSGGQASSNPGGGSGGAAGSAIEVGTPYVIQTASSTPSPELGLAADAAVKWINSHGGIKGHSLQVAKCDDHFTSAGAAACMQQFAGNKNLLAVVGGDDCFADVSDALLKSSGLPWLAAGGCGANSYTGSEFTLLGGGVVADARALGVMVAQQKTPAEIITFNLPQADVIVNSITDSATAAGGTILGAVRVDPATVDMTAAVASALKHHPQAIIPQTSTAQIASTVQALRQQGFTGKIMLAASQVPAATLASLGGSSKQIVGEMAEAPVPAPAANLPAITEFRTEMRAVGASGAQMTSAAFQTWLAYHEFYSAAAKATSLTRAAILAATKGLANWQYGQATPPLTFSAPGPFKNYPNIVMHWAAILSVHNNQWVWDGKWTDLAASGS